MEPAARSGHPAVARPDGQQPGLLAAQIRLNERETENAPSSVLRLWRSFLGWVLALLFCWEVPVRLLLLPLLAPDLLDDLPPPALDQILGLLAGMLGLPF